MTGNSLVGGFTTVLLALAILQQVSATGVDESTFRITKLKVPLHPDRYTNLTLECHVDLGDYDLYFIKWYHNDVVFFRYLPANNKTTPETILHYIDNPNVKIIKEKSTGEKVVLREVDLSASGNYMCETNSVYPEVLQDSENANMTVVDLPKEQPNIEGEVADHYAVGDTVNLNCTAAPSTPAASLVWFINSMQAPEDYVHEYEHEEQSDGLKVSRLGLTFKLTDQHFIKGELRLKCTATIATLYTKSDEHSQHDPKPTSPKEVRKKPEGGSLVTSTDPTSSSTSLLGKNSRLLSHLLPLHTFILLPLLVSLHLLR